MQAWIAWLILAVIAAIVEVFTMSFYFLIFGIGALLASVVAWFNFSIYVQLIVAAVVILALLPFLPKILRKTFASNKRSSNMVGDNAILDGEIVLGPDGNFRVKYQGDTFPLALQDDKAELELGQKVDILKFIGITAHIAIKKD